MDEQKFIIVVEKGKIVYKGKERRKLRHYKGREGQSHDSIAKEHQVALDNIVERGLILMGEVYVLECKEGTHMTKIQHSSKGIAQQVLEWNIKNEDIRGADKIRPSYEYIKKRKDLDGD